MIFTFEIWVTLYFLWSLLNILLTISTFVTHTKVLVDFLPYLINLYCDAAQQTLY